MKKTIFSLAFLLITLAFYAQSLEPVYDGFDYTVGQPLIIDPSMAGVEGNGQWSLQAPSTSAEVDVVAQPAWNIPGLPPTTGAAVFYQNSGIDPQLKLKDGTGDPFKVNTGTIYSSCVFRISDLTGVTDDFYFYSLADGNTAETSTSYYAGIWVQNIDDTTFRLGTNRRNNTTPVFDMSTTYNLNEDIFVVIGYDFDTSTASIWVNPPFNGTQPAANATDNDAADGTINEIDRLRITASSTARTPDVTLDEIRADVTWVGVVPNTVILNTPKFSNNSFAIYSPSRGVFRIDTKDNFSLKSLEVFNTLGQSILKKTSDLTTLNLTSQRSGVYFISVNDGPIEKIAF